MALILDTGPVLAALDKSDPDHPACAKLIKQSKEELILPSPILVELDYLFDRTIGDQALPALISEIRDGVFRVEDCTLEDYARIQELLTQYTDAQIGFVDAAVLSIVERLDEPKLATLDRRHFTFMQPQHVVSLELLP